MSTSCTVTFVQQWGGETPDTDEAKVYLHYDGDPATVTDELTQFFHRVMILDDHRLDDASYLAARFLVSVADQYTSSVDDCDFAGVGIVLTDPGDLSYTYRVLCPRTWSEHDPLPTIQHKAVR